MRFFRLALLPLLGLLAAVAGLSCSGGSDDSPTQTPAGDQSPTQTPAPTGNLFVNPGFEEGDDPWFTIVEESGFEVTTELAHEGDSSAVLRMDDPDSAEGSKVYYLVQEITPAELPEVVEGFYRVENWSRGAVRQYVQFVIIALGPSNFPDFASNFQLRYLLAGINTPPFNIGNAKFVFGTREEPVEGEWVPINLNVREDFEERWGMVPENFEKLRLLFEVRWDAKAAGGGAPRGDVYYDDLYIGDKR